MLQIFFPILTISPKNEMKKAHAKRLAVSGTVREDYADAPNMIFAIEDPLRVAPNPGDSRIYRAMRKLWLTKPEPGSQLPEPGHSGSHSH